MSTPRRRSRRSKRGSRSPVAGSPYAGLATVYSVGLGGGGGGGGGSSGSGSAAAVDAAVERRVAAALEYCRRQRVLESAQVKAERERIARRELEAERRAVEMRTEKVALESRVVALKRRVRELEDELTAAVTAPSPPRVDVKLISQLRAEIERLQAEREVDNQTISTLSREVAKARHEQQAMRDELARTEHALSQLETIKSEVSASAQRDAEDLRRHWSAAEEDIRNLREDNTALRRKWSVAEEEKRNANSDVELLRLQWSRAEEDRRRALADAEAALSCAELANADVASLRHEVDELRAQNAAIRRQLMEREKGLAVLDVAAAPEPRKRSGRRKSPSTRRGLKLKKKGQPVSPSAPPASPLVRVAHRLETSSQRKMRKRRSGGNHSLLQGRSPVPDRLSGEVEELRRRWAEVDAERRRLLAENNSLRNSWSQAEVERRSLARANLGLEAGSPPPSFRHLGGLGLSPPVRYSRSPPGYDDARGHGGGGSSLRASSPAGGGRAMRSPNVSVVDNGRVTIVSETLALDSPPQDRIPLGALLAVPGGRSGDESDGGAYSADYSIASAPLDSESGDDEDGDSDSRMYREDMDLPSTLNAGLRAPLVPSAPDDDDGLDADSLEASDDEAGADRKAAASARISSWVQARMASSARDGSGVVLGSSRVVAATAPEEEAEAEAGEGEEFGDGGYDDDDDDEYDVYDGSDGDGISDGYVDDDEGSLEAETRVPVASFEESLRRAADGHRDVSVDEIVYRNSAEVVSGRLAAASPGSDFYVAYHVGASPPEALAYELSRDGDGSYSYDDDDEGGGGGGSGDGDGGAAVGGGSPEPSAPPASDRSSRFLIGRVGGASAGGGYSPSSDPFLQAARVPVEELLKREGLA